MEDRGCLRVGAGGVCQPPLPLPLSSTEPVLPNEERGMKTETPLTPGCAPLSLTRGYSHVTPNGVSVCVPQLALELREKAKTSKRGCTRKLQPPMNTDGHG